MFKINSMRLSSYRSLCKLLESRTFAIPINSSNRGERVHTKPWEWGRKWNSKQPPVQLEETDIVINKCIYCFSLMTLLARELYLKFSVRSKEKVSLQCNGPLPSCCPLRSARRRSCRGGRAARTGQRARSPISTFYKYTMAHVQEFILPVMTRKKVYLADLGRNFEMRLWTLRSASI